jgi:hypothetical protein
MVEARKSSRPWGGWSDSSSREERTGGLGGFKGGGVRNDQNSCGTYEYGALNRCSLTNRGNKGLNLSGS